MRLPQNLFDGDVSVQVILCQPDKTRIGEILPYDKKGTLKFNSYSEISLTIDRYYNDLITGETKVNPYYDLIESPRIIELRGIGHFVIQDGNESISDSETKSITAFSLEHSTGQKYLENFYVNTGEEGSVETMYHARTHSAEYAIDVYYEKATTWDKFERYYKKEYTKTNAYNYVEVPVFDENDFINNYKGENSENTLYVKAYPNVRFYWPTKPELSLLHLVIAHIPEWKIGHVDKELWYEERTFSEDRTAVYDFLYNTAAPTFKFVMVWDTIGDENTVSFYKAEEDGITTQLTPASRYIDGIIYFNEDGSEASPQPKNNDDVLLGNYFVQYDAIETQWDTDVFISKDNLASQIDISYSADDIKTKLKISGADTLDVRDVNLGQNYILNLSYYNDDLWMGKDLHAKYDKYTKYLAEKTGEYSKLISKWSAAYNEYSDLINNVPIEPSVLLIGDKFDKLYCTYGLIKATDYVENKTYYNLNGEPTTPTYDKDKKITSDHYINKASELLPELKKKLGLYHVGVDDNGQISQIDKTDDVLLTLTNSNSDSVTIRIKCTTNSSDYQARKYSILRTLTYASNGAISTKEWKEDDGGLTKWIKGELTASEMWLTSGSEGKGEPNFTVKSIGALGAYLCLSKDETKKENIEDYGIRLLEEKQATYTKIFITQTEGYMSKEGSQCIAADTVPSTTDLAVGTKWLNTKSTNAEVRQWDGKEWKNYSSENNSAEFENYTRFLDNYEKLQVVQEVLREKQLVADYLLNGIAVNELYLTAENIDLTNLLIAAIFHHIVLNNDYIISASQPTNPTEGMIWIQRDEALIKTTVYKYSNGMWSSLGDNFDSFNAILTNFISDAERNYGYLTYVYDPEYKKAEKYSEQYTYFVKDNNGKYNKFYAQPSNDSDVLNTYAGNIVEGATIAKDTVCYFTIGGKKYTFKAPQDLNKNSILLCNPDTNKLIVGITTSELELYEDNSINDTTNLSFTRVEYWVAEGLEYAVYTTNGTPYVSYSHSQGMCLAQMNYIKELTDMNNYFNEAERMRLSPFIKEDEYSDDNFLLTGYESEAEQMDVKKSLLKAGTEELAKICKPRLSFDATMANLLAIPEFAPLRWQFKLGNFVSVGLREPYNIPENVKKARLLEVQINFEDASDFSCTFGDLESTKSLVDKHADLLAQSVTVAKQVATHASNWQKGANVATALDKAIAGGLQDATLEVGKANNQSIQIGPNGIWGRKLRDGTTDEWEDEQFRLINNKLVFSSDGFKTSKAVFGKYTINGETRWGPLAEYVTADTIEGKFLKGGSIQIGDPDNEKGSLFVVNEDGSVEIKFNGKDKYVSPDAIETIDQAYRYSVALSYSGPTVFASIDDSIKTTITATVYERGNDITDSISASKFNWIRSSSDANSDIEWNAKTEHKGVKQITIDHRDVIENSHFSCQVEI